MKNLKTWSVIVIKFSDLRSEFSKLLVRKSIGDICLYMFTSLCLFVFLLFKRIHVGVHVYVPIYGALNYFNQKSAKHTAPPRLALACLLHSKHFCTTEERRKNNSFIEVNMHARCFKNYSFMGFLA